MNERASERIHLHAYQLVCILPSYATHFPFLLRLWLLRVVDCVCVCVCVVGSVVCVWRRRMRRKEKEKRRETCCFDKDEKIFYTPKLKAIATRRKRSQAGMSDEKKPLADSHTHEPALSYLPISVKKSPTIMLTSATIYPLGMFRSREVK